jgi:hypothetical protein
VLGAYNDALRDVWYLALGLSCLTLLASFGMEWKNVKAKAATGDVEPNMHESKAAHTDDISARHEKEDNKPR